MEVENLQFAQGIGLGGFAEWFPFIVFETITWSTVGVYVSIYLPIIINEDTSKLIVTRLCLPLLNSVSLAPMALGLSRCCTFIILFATSVQVCSVSCLSMCLSIF